MELIYLRLEYRPFTPLYYFLLLFTSGVYFTTAGMSLTGELSPDGTGFQSL